MNIEELKGKVLVSVEGEKGGEEIIFTTKEGEKYKLYHDQECCESVIIQDICGDLGDLVDSPIVMAEEVIHRNENPPDIKPPKYQDNFTWTFYKLATLNGYVTIRWYGESNGYYSETVDFEIEKLPDDCAKPVKE